MERLETELVGGADLRVSSLVEKDESGERDAPSAATPSEEGGPEPLDPLFANFASKVPLSISSSDFEVEEETVPAEANPRIVHSVVGTTTTLLHRDSSSGLGAVCVNTEGFIAGLKPLP